MLCLASDEAMEAEEVLAAGCGVRVGNHFTTHGTHKSRSGECTSMFLSPICHLHFFTA